jgi:transposase InsO family protein
VAAAVPLAHPQSDEVLALALWDSLCNILGIKHMQTTAYHPQAKGLVERFHRRLKDALHTRLAGPTWTAHLPWVLLGLRAAPREEDNISPAQAVFGTPIVLLGQF